MADETRETREQAYEEEEAPQDAEETAASSPASTATAATTPVSAAERRTVTGSSARASGTVERYRRGREQPSWAARWGVVVGGDHARVGTVCEQALTDGSKDSHRALLW